MEQSAEANKTYREANGQTKIYAESLFFNIVPLKKYHRLNSIFRNCDFQWETAKLDREASCGLDSLRSCGNLHNEENSS